MNFDEFINALEHFGHDIKTELDDWSEAIGHEFLNLVKEQIQIKENVDTRLLINSFTKGHPNNIFIKKGDATYEFGTNVFYADFVNTGHRLRGGGWWEGSHYFDEAQKDFEALVDISLERKVNSLLDKYFR